MLKEGGREVVIPSRRSAARDDNSTSHMFAALYLPDFELQAALRQYTEADGATSTVASCDIYDFIDERI